MTHTLETPVPLFQHEREFAPLLDLYREREPRRVLEIGTYHGGTLYHWLRYAAPGAVVVSIDSYAVGVDNRALYDSWAPETVTCVALVGDSRDPATIRAAAEHAPYGWLFIDGGHYYDEVSADWENYLPLMGESGVVAFHDILPPSREHPEIEVAQLWSEIAPTHRTMEFIEDESASWGGIGVVLL